MMQAPERPPMSDSFHDHGPEPGKPTLGEQHQHGPDALAGKAVDPVCGMKVDPQKTEHRATYLDHTYSFCSAGCRAKFTSDPAKYLDARPDTPLAAAGTIYTCPMHSQI